MKRVLFVDDEEGVRLAWNRYLRQNGFDVVTAADGAGAVARLEDDKGVDVVISDLKMPGLDGLQLLEWVHDRKPDTPFILLTGYGNEEIERKARALGAFDYLNKPISPEALSAVVTGALIADRKQMVAPVMEVVAAEPKAKAKPAKPTFLKTVGGLILAPILGLSFVLFLPVIGFAMLFKVIIEAVRKQSVAAGS
jgi:DNA-binding NtrC family response regulator